MLEQEEHVTTPGPSTGPQLGGETEAERLRLFQFSLDQAPDGVLWMDREGRIYYANERACRSLGYARDELTRLCLWDVDPVFPKEVWDANWDQYRKSADVATRHFESLHRRKDGAVFPVEISSKHIRFGETEFHVAFVRDITERKRVEEALRLTQSAIDRASNACTWLDSGGRFVYVNDQACRSLGYGRDELLRLTVHDIDPLVPPESWERLWEELREKKVLTFETVHLRKDGTRFPVEITANFLDFDGKAYSCAFERDLTEWKRAEEERKKLEEQLLQAGKMEAVGRLAGGVAHDFNNMLSVILGYVDLLKGRLSGTGDFSTELSEVEKAALRSRDLTRQLLAFSRKQVASPRPVNLNSVLEGTRGTLARLIGEDVELRLRPGPALWDVEIDPSQLDQILVNLAVNARDAMPEGGTLTIATANVEERAARGDRSPGPHVLLEVSDDGCGMDRETLGNIFEPFFTTKGLGRGTGLGLATVYGIVKQNGGFITASSALGRGTTFQIRLPRARPGASSPTSTKDAAPVRGSETVLLVEDDEMVRGMVEGMLRQLGYGVLAAGAPTEGLALLESGGRPLDLLLTDVVMPGMKGPELAARARKLRPGLKVLLMSGYTDSALPGDAGVHFLQKPFGLLELSSKLREALSGPT